MSPDFARAHQTRSDAYRLLAACFYEPEKELLEEENLCANLAGLMEQICPAATSACREMAQGLRDKSQDELLVDYTALFLGPFNAPAHPYGSVYLENDRRLMGDTTMAVRNIYQEAGVQDNSDGPPDHIAIELEFMSFLEQRIAEAAANEEALADFIAIRQRFFNGFLANWAPRLGMAMQEHAELPFYRALGKCLTEFIAAERQRIKQPAKAAAV